MADTHRPDPVKHAGQSRSISEVGAGPLQRPTLRIETSFPPTRLVRPVPIRLAGVAPPARTSTYGDFAAAQRRTSSLWKQNQARAKEPQTAGRRNREFAVMTFDFDATDENAIRRLTAIESDLFCGDDLDTDGRLLRIGVDDFDVDVEIAPRPKAARGHRRRLSDKVKSFLTFGRTSISSQEADEIPTEEDGDDNRLAPPSRVVLVPPRPYRSPSTASYLVSRHSELLDDDGSETEYGSSRRLSQWSDATSVTARASVHTFGSDWKFPLHAGDATKKPEEEDIAVREEPVRGTASER